MLEFEFGHAMFLVGNYASVHLTGGAVRNVPQSVATESLLIHCGVLVMRLGGATVHLLIMICVSRPPS